MPKRVFVVVLDSFGIGEEPDAAAYGDEGSNTLCACATSGVLNITNMTKLGLLNIDGALVHLFRDMSCYPPIMVTEPIPIR